MGAEVGNEDGKDTSRSYNAYRYPMFYDAIKAAFPAMPVVATTPVTSRPVDILDEHFYNSPNWFAENAHRFDSASRTGSKVLVGEYEATQGESTGTLAAAVAQAAFLTGLERDANVVVGASYAPLLTNVNARDWGRDFIAYNGLSSYGSPSYYMQEMLATLHGDHVIGSQLASGTGTLFAVASRDASATYVAVVNDGPSPAPTKITLADLPPPAGAAATVLAGNPASTNLLQAPTQVEPRTTVLGPLHPSFDYTFAPNSVTVLQLSGA
jgi:alpha-L-arabinofuranosidase